MNSTPMAKLAVAVTLGFFVVLLVLMFAPVNQAMKDPLLLMLGALISSFTSIVSYYFGTTSSSAKKDETITELTRTAAAVAGNATAPAKVGEVQIDAQSVTVDTQKGTPA
jgi:hypothetical protein